MWYFIKNNKRRDLLVLSLLYVVSHGFLLITTGRWWDDWCFYLQEDFALKTMALDMGRPTFIGIVKFLRLFPEPCYRILTFFMFFYCAIAFYKILNKCFKLSDDISLWISALFVTVPVNVDRIMFSIFPYTLGLFCFMVAIDIFYNYYYGSKNIALRISSLLFFLFSFVLNSNLFMYVVLFLVLIYKNKNMICLLKYIDFILLPIIFFTAKIVFFPTSGLFVGYNSVTIPKLVKAASLIPIAAVHEIWATIKNYFAIDAKYLLIYLRLFPVIVLLCNITGIVEYIKKCISLSKICKISYNIKYNENKSFMTRFIVFVIGFVLLMIGLFPYVVIRQSANIGIERGAVLVPFGFSIIIFSIFTILFNKNVLKYCLMFIVLLGTVYFNISYIKFQNNFYQMQGFQYQIAQNDNLAKQGKNLLYINDNCPLGVLNAFYSLNKAYYEVTGKQDKFIIDKERLQCLSKKDWVEYFISSRNYGMSEYVYDGAQVDAVLDYSFNCSLKGTLKLKFYELFCKKAFKEEIKKRSALHIYDRKSKQFDDYMPSRTHFL